MKRLFTTLSGVIAVAVAATALTVIPAAAAGQRVTIVPAPSSVDVGQTAHLTGTVTPGAPGKQIRLQRFYNDAWHPYKWKYLTAQSTYDFGVKINGAGAYVFRVASPSGASRAITLKIYGWLDLTKLPTLANNYMDCGNVRTTNGKFFAHACRILGIWNRVDEFIGQWNLKRQCSTFRATVGLDDEDNPDSAQVQLEATNELDQSLYKHTFALGQSADVSVNIADDLRLKFTTLGMDDTNHGWQWIVLGNPRIRCTWRL